MKKINTKARFHVMAVGLGMMAVGFSAVPSAKAADAASDNASNAAYTDGWQAGDNGGYGFGAWVLQPDGGAANMIVNSAANNGPGGGSSSIDTSGVSWGLLGNGGSAPGDVTRSFTGGALSLGQTFSLGFDNGWGAGGQAFGLGLLAGTVSVVEVFMFDGSDGHLNVNQVGNSAFEVAHGFTTDGCDISFTPTSATTATISLTFLDNNSVETFNLTGLTGADSIDNVRFFNYMSSGAPNQATYYNSLSIEAVPEPSTLAVAGLGGLAILLLRNTRRK